MFKVDKVQIGKHIADLIDASEYKTDRQFGIAYLKELKSAFAISS